MGFYSNVNEDMINLRKIYEQQKKQRALKNGNRILNQTHDMKAAETLSPKTKKLEEVKESSQNLGDVIKKNIQQKQPQPSENIKPNLQNSQSQTPKLVSTSDEVVKTFSKTNDSKSFFKEKRDAEGKFSWGGKKVIQSGRNRVEINSEDYNLTPEIQRPFNETRYSFNNIDMGDENVLTFDRILNSLNYDSSKDSNSKRTKSIENDLRK